MIDETNILAAESRYFAALLAADRTELEHVLGPDFVLIDVFNGTEIARAAFLDLVGSGDLRLDTIVRRDARVRVYEGAAVVIGATVIDGWFGPRAFHVASRHTHVYARGAVSWRLVLAQGTRIAAERGGGPAGSGG